MTASRFSGLWIVGSVVFDVVQQASAGTTIGFSPVYFLGITRNSKEKDTGHYLTWPSLTFPGHATRRRQVGLMRPLVNRLNTLSNRKDTYNQKIYKNQSYTLETSGRQSIVFTSITQTALTDKRLYDQGVNRRDLYQEKSVYFKIRSDNRNTDEP